MPLIADDSPWRRNLKEAGLFLVVLAFAWYFVWLRYQLNRPLPQVALNALADGLAPKPFQYRILVPWLAGTLSSFGWGGLMDWYRGIEVSALVGLYYSFRLLLSQFVERASTLLSFTVFYSLAWNILLARDRPALLPYDLASVAIMTACVAVIVRGQWLWYYPLFLLGALNRETILFCTLFFLLSNWKQMPKGRLALHVAVQVALWVSVKLILMSLYSDNRGQDFEYYHTSTTVPHWRTNLAMLLNWRFVIMVASAFGFIWLLIPIGWRRLTIPTLRQLPLVTVPYFLVLLFLGNLNELRAYAEILPFVLVPALVVGREMIMPKS